MTYLDQHQHIKKANKKLADVGMTFVPTLWPMYRRWLSVGGQPSWPTSARHRHCVMQMFNSTLARSFADVGTMYTKSNCQPWANVGLRMGRWVHTDSLITYGRQRQAKIDDVRAEQHVHYTIALLYFYGYSPLATDSAACEGLSESCRQICSVLCSFVCVVAWLCCQYVY